MNARPQLDAPPSRPLKILGLTAWLLAGLLLCGPLRAQVAGTGTDSSLAAAPRTETGEQPPLAPASPAPTTLLIHSISEFWALSQEQRRLPVDFDLECFVTYYDAMWSRLWIQDGGSAAFVQTGSAPLPIRAGQRIRATGRTKGSGDLSFEGASFVFLEKASPAPLVVNRNLEHHELLNNKLVTVEGIVDRTEHFEGPRHHLFLCIQGRLAYVWLHYPAGSPPPILDQMHVRLTGVYAVRQSQTGEVASIELMVASPEQVQIISPLDRDKRFDGPSIDIGKLPQLPSNELVLLRGRVVSHNPGHSLTIRDDTGQIQVLSAQGISCPVGSQIEAIGYPFIISTAWHLREASFRHPPNPVSSDPSKAPSTIKLAAQLTEITPEQAASGIPVQMSGVVTWSHPDAPFFFIQDASGGACIYRGTDTNKIRPTGRSVDIIGNTALGDFAPVVTASKVTKTGDTMLPDAVSTSLEAALSGSAEALWVEMRGYLRNMYHEGQYTRLEISTPAGDFNAFLSAKEYLPDLSGAVVRVTGVCNAQTNERRQIKAIRLWVPAAANIQIEQEAPKDLFDTPYRSLSSIGQFGAPLSTHRRVKLSGTVLHHTPGHSLYLYEKGEALLVQTRDTLQLNPGDTIEAVGFLSRQGPRIVLREGTCRKTGSTATPRPLEISQASVLHEETDGRLARLTATLVDAATLGRQTRLALQQESSFFEAFISTDAWAPLDTACPPGSQILLTGVYELKYDELGRPLGFQLHLRDADDIGVLSTPSWFTRSRIIAITASLLVTILLFTSWVVALRRRVNRQMRQIREQLQRESHMEADLQRASKLESLGLLAGGIAHDFNNLLTVIMGNLSLSVNDPGLSEESRDSMRDASNAVNRARDLTQQLLTFAKGGAPVRSAIMIADIVKEVCLFSVSGSKVACEFHFAPDLVPANVDKGQISQVVQNIVINAVQAMPEGGLMMVHLHNEKVTREFGPILEPGNYICLTLRDNGPGIPPEHLGRIFDPYFTTRKSGNGIGLATVHSIVRKHLGHISVESTLGKGTCFRIWLPAATGNPEPSTHHEANALPSLRGRVLVLDDEPDVRRLASAMLRRLGLDCVTAPDGGEAIRLFREALQSGHPFDLLILDLTVPGGLGGIQVMEKLADVHPRPRAIVSSGYSSELSLSHYSECGFIDVVPKPYEISDLGKALARHLPAA